MRKRILALVVMLFMIIGMTTQMAAAAEPSTFDVGYAKVDVNPYKDGTGESQELAAIPLGGGAQTTTRLSTGKIDDNGDGVVDENDGIFVTCIAITDHNGKTVLMISCDFNNTYADFFDSARQKILEKFADQGVETDRILVNASHNHSAPMMVPRFGNGYDFSDDYKAYRERLIDQVVKAAELALLDRAPATMSKGEIDASDSVAASDGVVGDTMNKLRTQNKITPLTISGERAYNGVRHYQITMKSANGKIMTYVCGDNFNMYRKVGSTAVENGISYTVIETKEVSEPDDTLKLVKFEFEDDTKLPIVMINWRAHVGIAKGTSDAAYYKVSGDYVNSLRYTLESGIVSQQKYRAAFFQGEAGNINSGTKLQSGLWMQIEHLELKQDRHNIYGTELAEVALECLENNMQSINQTGGEIRSTYDFYQTQRRQVSIYEYMAGLQYKAEYDNTEGGITGNRTYKNKAYALDENGQPMINPTTGEPYELTGDKLVEAGDTGSVTIASVFHANSMIDGYKNNTTPGLKMELHAITIGEDFSLMSAGGELFDRYSEKGDLSENMWDNVEVDFVLGYTNTCGSYLSSTAAYEFNQQNEHMAVGSYETMSTSFEKGVGETILLRLNDMLTSLRTEEVAPETEAGNCEHCGEDVQWTELTEEGELSLSSAVRTGHYILNKDVTLVDKDVMFGGKVCLNLNGHTLTVKQSFSVPYGATLSIVGEGTVIGEEAATNGGVFAVDKDGELNLYHATLRYAGECGEAGAYQEEGTTNGRTIPSGGILYVNGIFNMYGGKIEGTNVYKSGGAILIGTTGVANIRGGEIREKDTETAFNAGQTGDCIRNAGIILLSGDAVIDEIYFRMTEGGPQLGESLIFDREYTGSVNLYLPDVETGSDIGVNKNGNISQADIRVNGEKELAPKLVKEDVILKRAGAVDFGDNTFVLIVCVVAAIIAVGIVVTIVIVKRKKKEQ